jgi:hypothetical protein
MLAERVGADAHEEDCRWRLINFIEVAVWSRGRRGVFVPFLPLIWSENAFATSVAVVSSPNSGNEVILLEE